MDIERRLKPFVKKAFPILSAFHKYRREYKLLHRDVEYREALGFYFNGSPAMEQGVFEPDETQVFHKIIEKFDLLVNIGANAGYYVCKALDAGKEVIAFEPNQLNVNVLLKNIEANRFEPDFQLFPVALSDHLGALPLFGANTGASLVEGWAGQTNSTLVPISTFDKTAGALVQGKSCLVLIDVEGAELGCQKGASSLLSANTKNVLLIEISVNEHQPSGIQINPNLVETFELMFSNDFKAFTVDAEFRQVELAEVVQIAETGMDSIGTHNFLFVKSDMSLDELGLPA